MSSLTGRSRSCIPDLVVQRRAGNIKKLCSFALISARLGKGFLES